jgi:hypothetical protein
MATEVSENTNVKTPLTFLIKVFGGTIFVVYSAMLIYARLNTLEMEILRLNHEVEMNSEFRVKWPRGELGSLPDDAEQNMRLSFIEKQIAKQEEVIEDFRYNKVTP